MSSPKTPPHSLPLGWLSRAAKRHRSVRLIAEHAHVLQILEDHRYELAVCTTEDERSQVCEECRRQVYLAVARVLGLDSAMHGVVLASTGHFGIGMTFFLLGALAAYLAMRMGGK